VYDRVSGFGFGVRVVLSAAPDCLAAVAERERDCHRRIVREKSETRIRIECGWKGERNADPRSLLSGTNARERDAYRETEVTASRLHDYLYIYIFHSVLTLDAYSIYLYIFLIWIYIYSGRVLCIVLLYVYKCIRTHAHTRVYYIHVSPPTKFTTTTAASKAPGNRVVRVVCVCNIMYNTRVRIILIYERVMYIY